MFLHAFQVGFRHPSDGRPVRLEAPLPQAFGRFAEDCDAPV